jgi:uncharacterized protein
MPGNPLVRFDEGRVGRTARCRLLSYSTEKLFAFRRCEAPAVARRWRYTADMDKVRSFLLCLPLSIGGLFAQAVPDHTVQGVGNATIAVNPDQAQLDVGVVTSANTAQQAAQQNADMSTAVQNAVKAVLGSSGSFQTVNYTVSPRYSNTPGQPSTVIGYTASNTVRVTTIDLSIIGKLIDAANAAGANSVNSLSFGLQDPEPSMNRALGLATKQAMAHANAIAAGLGLKTGAVFSAQQGSSYTPIVLAGGGVATASTPVQTGTVNVYGTVTVNVLLVQ